MTKHSPTPQVPAPAQERLKTLWDQGLTIRQIAEEMGVSTQRVYGLVAKLRARGELPDRAA